MKKALITLLSLTFILGAFAGCGKSEKTENNSQVSLNNNSSAAASSSNASSETSSDTSTVLPGFDISSVNFSTDDVSFLDTDKSSVYTVVSNGESPYSEVADTLAKSMKKTLGVNVKSVKDTDKDGTDAYEILVGSSNRSETQAARCYLLEAGTARMNDFLIATIGKKIVITANSDQALSSAVDFFLNNIVSKDIVKGGINYISKTDSDAVNYTVNGAALGKFNVVRPHYNSSYLTQVEMEKLCDTALIGGKYNIGIVEDMYVDEGIYEIIVGNNNREGVEEITDHDEYRITVKGYKVYLNGGSPHATAVAVTEFCKLLFSKNVTDADSVVGSYSATVATYDDTQYYIHKWGDDFDGIELDTTKWDNIVSEKHYSSLGDGSESWRVEEATFVSDGYLYQLQYYDKSQDKYFGGTIRSNSHMKFLGGYLEHSVITPDNPVSWNTLWMQSAESNGVVGPEIDLNENFGNASVTHFNVHTWPADGNEYGWKHRSFDSLKPNEKKYRLPEADTTEHNLNTEFHTFGFLWTQDYIAFIGDGEIYVDMDLNAEGFEDFKMAYTTVACKVIIAASPGTTGKASSLTSEHWERSKSDYVTDYVHIYQLNDGWSRISVNY